MTEVTKASPPASSTSTWSWDSLDRLVSSTDANGATVAYSYDLRGAVDTITYPGGTRTVDRDYDDAGRWRAVTDWAGNTTTFGYDDDDNLTTRAAPGATGVVDSFGYDNPGRLRSVSVAKGAGPLASFAYGRDGAGRLTSVASTGVAANDQVVVAATVPGSKKATTPSGYTSVGTWASGTKAAHAKVQVFRRTAGGGETSVTVSFGQAYAKALNVVVYRGVHPTSPVDAAPQAATANAATSVTAPSITTTAMAEYCRLAAAAVTPTWGSRAGNPHRRSNAPADGSVDGRHVGATRRSAWPGVAALVAAAGRQRSWTPSCRRSPGWSGVTALPSVGASQGGAAAPSAPPCRARANAG